ncbi:MAG: cation:proton antiporter [Burkholderiaceae bacterium]|nr:cation:proton antiporter [Burkholderiaceae bacterium]
MAILVRFAWVFPVAYLPTGSAAARIEQALKPRRRERRSSVGAACAVSSALAAVGAADGDAERPAFPARDLIIFLTFFVIATTLVGQGLTLALDSQA